MEDNKSASESKEKDISLKGVVGIQNMGNTCYLNSIIQLLRVSPELNMYILSSDFSNITNKHKDIILAYQDINRALWSTYKSAYVRPLGFISEIRKAVKDTVYEMFGTPIPNDSHEFLIYLLDNFHEATKTPINSEKRSLGSEKQESGSDKIRSLARKGWEEFLSKNNSQIVKLFFGMYRKTIICTNCNNKTYNWEVFNSLKIPCEGTTFKEWIKEECKDSEIEGYNCEECKNRYTAKIYTHIWRLPTNLFITLRRFNYDGRKNMTKCPYNGEIFDFKEFFADESDHKSKSWSYELRGVSDHHGSHLGGHYTTQFKHQISGEWWWMDDESTHKMENPVFSPSNYILLFRKNN
jgi:ubiquitin C-terminal hydrolase